MKCPFQFTLEISGPEAQALGQFPISPDWLPVEEALRFEIMRHGDDKPLRADDIVIDPRWSEQGAPYVSSLAVSAPGSPSVAIPVKYFKGEVRKIEAQLVAQEKLKKGDAYTFKTLAYARTEAPAPARKGIFVIEDEEVESPVAEREIAPLVARSTTDDETLESAEALRVFIPQSILDETRGIAEAAGNVETGGLLIGHVHRDPVEPVIFLEVTAQIPAAHTNASVTSLNFSDDTWLAARAAMNIRNRGESMIAWWHSHPSKWFCNESCPLEKRLACHLQQSYLSADDLLLHRTVYPKAWQVALLVNVADAGTTHTAWGWHAGSVRQIPFRVLALAPAAPPRAKAKPRELATA
ncbi:MAG: Mov34/MPN/PAD-1 family protein [Verrucomicrobiaceae bacterium]|nr:Mov34/MPN/PAD-1 family protein [Verrucomicrobiaceae bacterium]